MRQLLTRILYLILFIYIIATMWFVYTMIYTGKHSNMKSNKNNVIRKDVALTKNSKQLNHMKRHVYVWGKAAIAEYFWIHIFEGELSQKPGYLLWEGILQLDNLKISYQTGAFLIPSSSKKSVTDLVIILNGREEKKIEFSKMWLDSLCNPEIFPSLKNLGVILLGDEHCKNDWLLQYIRKFNNLLKFVFVVYDIAEKPSLPVYQWPLGVATYRKFPLLSKSNIDIYSEREYVCNFLGTIYEGSSRVLLNRILKENSKMFHCFVKVRFTWEPKETKESAKIYRNILQNSDLTLCPVGINSESYRIYEALSYGSVPILEDIMTPGQCGNSGDSSNIFKAPFKLLKKYEAPVIYVKDWLELPDLLRKESLLSHKQKVERRQKILDWYSLFRYKIREVFLNEIFTKFQ